MRAAPLPSRFRLLWAATIVSNIGDGVRATALPLLATSLTRDPRLVAGVAVAERIPWLVFILPGGVWADRYDRRKLRVGLDAARALIVGALAVLVALDLGTIVAIYVTAAVLAAAESIVDSSSVALVPALVDDDQLERSGGLLVASEIVAGSLLGPPLGGLLFGLAVAVPFGLDAVSFLVAAVLAAAISGTFKPDSATPAAATSLRADMVEGMRWLWRQTLMRNLALVSMALGLASYVTVAIFVLFAQDELGLGSLGFGLLLILPAAGGLFGSLAAPRLRSLDLSTVLTTSVLTSGAATIIIGISETVAVVAVLLAIEMFAIVVWNVLTLALRQRLIPDQLLGRVGASYRFLVYVGMPFGAMLGGVLADTVGLRQTYLYTGAVLIAVGLIVPFAIRGGNATGAVGDPADRDPAAR
jgi:MFS family permease